MSKPLLIMMSGLPGSGKSHFASRLSKELPAAWLNSDSIRKAIFGEKGKGRTEDRQLLVTGLFKGLYLIVREILAAGGSVIIDANHNKRATRDELRQIAADANGLAVVVHIKTPQELSDHRAKSREAADHQVPLSQEKLDFFKAQEELPSEGELVIFIDGTISYDEQLKSFSEQLREFGED